MPLPIVSVVMSVFNCERFLHEAIESILCQSLADFEFIIINDGSADRSGQILETYKRIDRRISVHHQENKGLVDSLNYGCAIATGKYIARMDADDISLRDRLAWQIEFMETHPCVAVAGGAIEVINSEGRYLGAYRNPQSDPEIKNALLKGHCRICHPTVVMRKEAFSLVGGYRRIVRHAEDYDLWLRLADHFQLANLLEIVLKYRRHFSQVSVQSCRQQALSCAAARASAVYRINGKPDPLNTINEVTSLSLVNLGVGVKSQELAAAIAYLSSIERMYDAGEKLMALRMADSLRKLEWRFAKRRITSECHILSARMSWSYQNFGKSLVAAVQAVIARPMIIGRPLRLLLRRRRQSEYTTRSLRGRPQVIVGTVRASRSQ